MASQAVTSWEFNRKSRSVEERRRRATRLARQTRLVLNRHPLPCSLWLLEISTISRPLWPPGEELGSARPRLRPRVDN